MPETIHDVAVYWGVGLFAVFILFLLLFRLADWFNDFSDELKLLNCEIQRTTGVERRRYIRQRRRLWLSLLPFVKYR